MEFYFRYVTFCFIVFMSSAFAENAIYGKDNRIEIYKAGIEIQILARSTVALMDRNLFDNVDRSWVYNRPSVTLALEYNLSSKAKFAEQVPQSFCSGSLISQDEVLTAFHCVENGIQKTLFTFDFKLNNDGSIPLSHHHHNVYTGVSLKNVPKAKDGFVIVTLDRPVVGRTPLKLTSDKSLKANKLFTIQYPSGLPAKYSDDAWVKDQYYSSVYKATIFEHNLDTFHGSSGSPIFDKDSLEVVGVLIDGEDDFRRRTLGRKFTDSHYSMNSREKSERGIFVSETFFK